jgi:pyruvate dehydrogenase (quinone)
MNVSDYVFSRLSEWGIKRIYGYPGDGINRLVSAGAMNAVDEVIAVADRLQVGWAKALLGKAVIPDNLLWVTGNIGLLGTHTSSDMMGDRHLN